MKKILNRILLLSFLILAGCDNSLDEKVYSDLLDNNYLYSKNEAYNVIGPVYSNMRGLFSATVTFFMVQECSADISVRPANSSGWDNAGIWRRFMLHSWTTEEWLLNETWNTLFSGAIHATRIIDEIESNKIPIPQGESKETFIAEMKVARAFYNWLILDNFGDAPLVKVVTQENPSKTPRAEIYQFVIDEINAALPDLSEDNGQKMYGRFNKWAAKALLANVYLNAEVYTGQTQWNECISECNDIINSGKYILEPSFRNNFLTNNENSLENIFAVPFDDIYATGFIIHNFSLNSQSKATYNLQSSPYGAGGFCANPQFIDSFDPEDSRLKDTYIMGPQFAADGITPILCAYDKKGQLLVYTKELPDGIFQAENEGYRIGKWEYKMGAKSNLSNDFPVFRYAQVLMMKAECLLRTGQKDLAAGIVTQVRQRDFIDNPGKAVVTGNQLEGNSGYQYGYVENYKIVDPGNTDPILYGRFLDELGWEFAVETTRRRDLIRFGVFTKKSWLSHKPNGDYRSVFPLIQGAINANPKLVQNPNYN